MLAYKAKEFAQCLSWASTNHHPNIISNFGFYFDSSQLLVLSVSEYVPFDLGQLLTHLPGALTDAKIAYVARAILSALNYLHKQDKQYCGCIKFSEVRFSIEGEVKLASNSNRFLSRYLNLSRPISLSF